MIKDLGAIPKNIKTISCGLSQSTKENYYNRQSNAYVQFFTSFETYIKS